MLGFDALDVQPLDSVEAIVWLTPSDALLVAVTLPAAIMQPGGMVLTPVLVAVELPPATITIGPPVVDPIAIAVVLPPVTTSPTLMATALEIAVVLPPIFQLVPVPTSGPLEIAVVLPALTIVLPPAPPAERTFTLLGQIDFVSPTPLTLYVSDHYVPPNVTGQEWLPLVQSWGPIDELVQAGAPVTSELVFFNTKPIAGKPRLSDLLRSPMNTTGTYEFAGARVTLYRLDEDTGAVSKLLNVLYIEEPNQVDDRLFRLRLSDQGLLLEDRLVVTRIDKTAFPLAQKPVINRTIPRAFGVLPNVPAIPVVDGALGRLAGALTASAVSIPLVDATDFLAAGTIQLDAEQISYTGKSGNTLTGCTRAVNATVAATHADQARVLQVRSGAKAYRYVVAEAIPFFGHQAITNVRVNGAPARTAPTVELNAADIVAGKYFAAINFSVTDPKAFHTIPTARAIPPAPDQTLDETFNWTGNQVVTRTLTMTLPNAGAEFVAGGVKRRCTITFTPISGSFSLSGTNSITRTDPATGAVVTLASDVTGPGIDFPASMTIEYDTGVSLAPEVFTLRLSGDADGYRVVWSVKDYSITSPIQAGGDGDSTAAQVIGEVTCDLEGMQDDATGSISGTGLQLLQNPVDVSRLIFTQLFGIQTAQLGTRWAASRAALATLPHRWALLLSFDGPEPFSEVRSLIAQQARCEVFVEAGVWDLVTIPDAPTALLTLDYRRDVWADQAAQASRSNRTQVFTSLHADAARNYATDDYEYAAVAEVPGLTDATRFKETLTFPWVQDHATADALVAFWLSQWKRQRWEIDLVAWENVLALRKADHIAVDQHPVLAAHGGAALIFRIIERSYKSGDENPARIRLFAREGNP